MERASPLNSLPKPAAIALAYLAHLALALFGTPILSSAGYAVTRFIVDHTIAKEWVFSIVAAGSLGAAWQRLWHSKAAFWIWVPALVWFAFGVVLTIASSGSVIASPQRGALYVLSGMGASENRYYFARFLFFTLPLVRTACYSLAAKLISLRTTTPTMAV